MHKDIHLRVLYNSLKKKVRMTMERMKKSLRHPYDRLKHRLPNIILINSLCGKKDCIKWYIQYDLGGEIIRLWMAYFSPSVTFFLYFLDFYSKILLL